MLKKGSQFPKFELENQNGELISNESIKGKKGCALFLPEG